MKIFVMVDGADWECVTNRKTVEKTDTESETVRERERNERKESEEKWVATCRASVWYQT